MSVFEAVLVEPDYSEAEDMSEDLALTKEFVRFANLHMGTKYRTFDDTCRHLFTDDIDPQRLKYLTRPDRTQLILTLSFLSTLRPILFPYGLAPSSLLTLSWLLSSTCQTLTGSEQLPATDVSSERLTDFLSRSSNMTDYRALMEKERIEELRAEIQRLSGEVGRGQKMGNLGQAMPTMPTMQTEGTQDIIFCEQEEIEGFNISHVANHSNMVAAATDTAFQISITMNVVLTVILCGITLAWLW